MGSVGQNSNDSFRRNYYKWVDLQTTNSETYEEKHNISDGFGGVFSASPSNI